MVVTLEQRDRDGASRPLTAPEELGLVRLFPKLEGLGELPSAAESELDVVTFCSPSPVPAIYTRVKQKLSKATIFVEIPE